MFELLIKLGLSVQALRQVGAKLSSSQLQR
jgi:hypothetical protein